MSAIHLLPPISSTPFRNKFDTNPYSYHDSERVRPSIPHESAISINNTRFFRPRQTSPASILSVASAPLPYNNENLAPASIDGFFSQPQSRLPSSERPGTSTCVPSKAQSGGLVDRPNTSTATPIKPNQFITLPKPSEDTNKDDLLQAALEDLEKYKVSRSQRDGDIHNRPSFEARATARSVTSPTPQLKSVPHVQPADQPANVKTGGYSTPHRKRTTTQTTSSEISSTPVLSPLLLRTRQSTTSSGFVHTIKTASFSNLSFGAISKRLRHGQSSESRILFGSHSRFSTDSDRPATVSSIDENALWRGVKRRRVLEELVTTEESYVADLKALVYLMSTLLASVTSIPTRVRTLVQRNVFDLLHLHERLVESLHRAAFKAAARKWADTLSPQRLESPRRHIRWRSLDSQATYRPSPGHGQGRSSVDSVNLSRTKARLVGTEPADLSDIVTIFRTAMGNFFAYEEYCANHEIIARDLQRHLPNLWSSYESGMESLARSLAAIDKRADDGSKALTVGDLLIKPIQRICKYPLMFKELLGYTPVSDDPSVHVELESLLQCMRDVVESVNHATQNPETRLQIHRRWALRSRLLFERVALSHEDFRSLGDIVLCGVLHVAYQTRHGVTGSYGLCVLFEQSLLVALPVAASAKFDIVALVHLQDLKVDSASDGKGLQSPSAFHTWKLSFAIEGILHEFIFSACSAVEEDQWKRGLQGELSQVTSVRSPKQVPSCLALDLKSVGAIYGRQGTLTRRLSVQRAATVGNRASISQVIIRNTHNPEELHEFRQPSTASINRSQSHMTSNRVIVLAPKRSERSRLESMLADVWTKDRLPYPGMIASRGGQIIRASAGSLARKLSLASIQGSFSRRSASLSISTRKSYDTLHEARRARDRVPTFEIRRDSFDDRPTPRPKRKTSHDVPELDSMDTVISRMIGDPLPIPKIPSSPKDDGIRRTGVLHKQPVQVTSLPVGPEDSAQGFYPEEVDKMQNNVSVEEALAGKSRKRWSNPMGLLRGRAAEGFRNMLYSTR